MVFESMKRSLDAVGIYGGDAPALEAELMAYAEGFEELYEELGIMFRERFISTAEGIGLSVYEELFGPERSDESAEKRREMLNLRMNLGAGDFTPAGIRRALDSLGLSYQISEFPKLGRLNVTALDDYSKARESFIRREVEKTVPVHLEFEITFNTLTWDDIDSMELTFSESDDLDMSWTQLDGRKPSDIQ